MNISSSIDNKIYFNKYKPDSKIGQGSFGKIYSAHNINDGELVALKLEKRKSHKSLLEVETYILCYLKGEGIPYIKSYGFSGNYNILVMELLGKSLETLFQENNSKFSLKTVCLLAEQMITRLEYIHKKYILHRDIKPDNFTIGRGKKSHIIYLIDFGLSKKYKSSKGNYEHIKYTENKKLIGTARYASINTMKGCEQGRRDDMESLGYVLMYFLRGNLPWQGLKVSKGDDRYKKIFEIKKETTAEELCVGFPKQFQEYIKYTRNLSFEQEPDYNYLKKLIYNVMDKYEFNLDYLFDWGIKKNKLNLSKYFTENKKKCDIKETNNNNQNKKKLKENVIKLTVKKEFKINENKKIHLKKKFPINNIKIIKNQNTYKTNNSKLSKTYFQRNSEHKNKINNIKKIKTSENNKKLINHNKIKSNFKTVESIQKNRKKFNKVDDKYIFIKLLDLTSSGETISFVNQSQDMQLRNSNYKFISELNSSCDKNRKLKKIWIKKEIPIINETKLKEKNTNNNCAIF